MSGDGYKQFLRFVSQLRESRMPETAKKWDKLNEGYRRLLFKQAGLVLIAAVSHDRAGDVARDVQAGRPGADRSRHSSGVN